MSGNGFFKQGWSVRLTRGALALVVSAGIGATMIMAAAPRVNAEPSNGQCYFFYGDGDAVPASASFCIGGGGDGIGGGSGDTGLRPYYPGHPGHADPPPTATPKPFPGITSVLNP